ncbi:helix-turn-helix domain-containing protein [Patescibacteria group bacterium]|nr:helix-turn-helix domain-containing protein [Patescibacteria group bacterium]
MAKEKQINFELSIGEAAEYVGVSRDTLRRWEVKGKVAPKRSPTNRRYYTKDQLDELMKKPADRQKVAKTSTGSSQSSSLKLVFYALLAVVLAVVLSIVIQLFFL